MKRAFEGISSQFRLRQAMAFRPAARKLRHFSTATSDHVTVVEVGPRDGLQNEPKVLSVENRIELIKLLYQAGCKRIEAGSFVSPKRVPAMANTRQVLQGLSLYKTDNPDLELSCLVPNVKGMNQALEDIKDIDEIAIFASASEGFSMANLQCSIDESFNRYEQVINEVQSYNETAKKKLRLRGYISCVVACPYDGRTPPLQVAKICEKMQMMGCDELSLGDTIGVGTVASTRALIDEVLHAVSPTMVAVHFHDTYGQALSNILASIERDIRTVDAAVAGLGGCPYAKGATGNVSTEDVVYLLDGLGLETGIDLDALVNAASFVCHELGHESRSRAGNAIAAKREK